jgi:hypothetical protein
MREPVGPLSDLQDARSQRGRHSDCGAEKTALIARRRSAPAGPSSTHLGPWQLLRSASTCRSTPPVARFVPRASGRPCFSRVDCAHWCNPHLVKSPISLDRSRPYNRFDMIENGAPVSAALARDFAGALLFHPLPCTMLMAQPQHRGVLRLPLVSLRRWDASSTAETDTRDDARNAATYRATL